MARLLNMRPDAEVEPHLEDHLNHLRKENQRPRSIRERRLTVLRVARNLGHPVADVTREQLVRWQDRRADLSPAAMHNEIVHVACYLKWLVRVQIRIDNPSEALVRPRNVHKRLPRPMADSDIMRALDAASGDLHLWIGLGAFCGLRCMEMAGLEADNVLGGYLRIIGKGDKERSVPLPANLRAEIASGNYPQRGHMFTRIDGKPGPPSAMRVSEIINDHLHSLGIVGTAHALRHRFGTEFYKATEDPYLTAQVMGHASTDTTKGYVEILAQRAVDPIEAISHLAA